MFEITPIPIATQRVHQSDLREYLRRRNHRIRAQAAETEQGGQLLRMLLAGADVEPGVISAGVMVKKSKTGTIVKKLKVW